MNNAIKVDAIIFDKDGTLIEFDNFWVKVSEKAIESILKKLQIQGCFVDEILRAIGVNNGVTDVNSILAKGTYLQIAQEVNKILTKNGYNYNLQMVTKVVLEAFNENYSVGEVVTTTPNLIELLSQFKKQNIRLAIVTTDNEYVTDICLKKLGIKELFDAIYTDDGKTPTKPDPYCVFDFCKKFNIDINNVVMVGDTLTDVNFAKNAGIKVFGLAKQERNKLILENKADVVIEDLSSINEIIG